MKARIYLIAWLVLMLCGVATRAQEETTPEENEAEQPPTGVFIVPAPGDNPQPQKPDQSQPDKLPESLIVGLPPVGSVIAWLKSLPNVPPLPGHWVECNGQVIQAPGSPLNGVQAPNLNGAEDQPQRFLRGAAESGATGGSEQHRHDPYLVQRTGNRRINVAERDYQKHLPPYYEVTWIMRVR